MTAWHDTIAVFGDGDVVLRTVVSAVCGHGVLYRSVIYQWCCRMTNGGHHCSLNVHNCRCWLTPCMPDNPSALVIRVGLPDPLCCWYVPFSTEGGARGWGLELSGHLQHSCLHLWCIGAGGESIEQSKEHPSLLGDLPHTPQSLSALAVLG